MQRRIGDEMELEDYNKWLAKAKHGDKTIYYSGHLGQEAYAVKSIAKLRDFVYQTAEEDKVLLCQHKGAKINGRVEWGYAAIKK